MEGGLRGHGRLSAWLPTGRTRYPEDSGETCERNTARSELEKGLHVVSKAAFEGWRQNSSVPELVVAE